MDDVIVLFQKFVKKPDDQELLRDVIKVVCERRDLFPTVSPRESIIQIAEKFLATVLG